MVNYGCVNALNDGNTMFVFPSTGPGSLEQVCTDDELPGPVAQATANQFYLECVNAGDGTWVFFPAPAPAPAGARGIQVLILPFEMAGLPGMVAALVYREGAGALENAQATQFLAEARDAELVGLAGLAEMDGDGGTSPDAFVDLDEMYLDQTTNEFVPGPTYAPPLLPPPTVVGTAVVVLCPEHVCGMVDVRPNVQYL